MNKVEQFLATRPFGPSQHRQFALTDRIAMYRRVIGHLRLEAKPKKTWREGFELRAAINEAMSITEVNLPNAAPQLAILTQLLTDCVNEQSAIESRLQKR